MNDPKLDDAEAIRSAFEDCGKDGHVIFENTTYYIGSTLNTTGLQNVDVEIKGTLLWSTDIDYWLGHSMPIGYQNQTSAWHLGGNGIHLYGHGYGTFDGNGQAWYNYNNGRSNLHGRPHAITITDTTNSVIEGLRFVRSQMWTMTVARSEKVLLQDIFVDNTSENDGQTHVNTDGVDTIYANNITFLRWEVENGDDAIAIKQNSTNIYIGNCTIHRGMGLAMGSIGQYPGQIEVIENVTAENIIFDGVHFAGRIKTWTGLHKGVPPNGGGGGLGYAKNITFRNFEMRDVYQAYLVEQCISYNGIPGGCDTSEFQVSGLRWINASGTLTGENVATFQCSAAAPCEDVDLSGNELVRAGSDADVSGFLCSNVQSQQGFECTGPCEDSRCHE
jgi:galacturan 1,4-alpha-galacturonidase